MFTTYGHGNYCYLTDALIYGFECHNFPLAKAIQFILNWSLFLIYSLMFGFLAWPMLLITLVLWLPIFWYGYTLFNNRRLKKLAFSPRKAD